MIPEYLFEEASERAQEYVSTFSIPDMSPDQIGEMYYEFFCDYLARVLRSQPVQILCLKDKRINIDSLQLIHIN